MDKPWYLQKSLWAGAALIITGIGQIVADSNIPEGIKTIAAGAAVIGLRQAIERMIKSVLSKGS